MNLKSQISQLKKLIRDRSGAKEKAATIQRAVRSALYKEFNQFELYDKGLPCLIPTEVVAKLPAILASFLQDTGLSARERIAAARVLLAANSHNMRIDKRDLDRTRSASQVHE